MPSIKGTCILKKWRIRRLGNESLNDKREILYKFYLGTKSTCLSRNMMWIYLTLLESEDKSFRTCATITSHSNLIILGNNPDFPINCSIDNKYLLTVTVPRLELDLYDTHNCELS